MTTRLYYTDPFCWTFDATVRRSLEHDGKPAVVLDQTAFYPTSGGQPYDTGRLGDTTVVDVIDAGDDIVHVLATPIAEGTPVTGDIDASRRFDHMQQHTGQHVLSAAFDRLFDNRTMSFHLGGETCTIDLAREMPQADVDAAAAEANRIVWDDRPVTIRFASEEDAARLSLRKEPARQGTLRLIEVSDFDLSACGGTHVSRTGAIGMIGVVGTEKFKGGSRVTFVCGGRALAAFHRYRASVAGAVRVLSVLPHELPAAVERVQLEAKQLRRTIGHLQGALAEHEARRLAAGATAMGVKADGATGTDAEATGTVRVVATSLEGWDAQGLKSLASAITSEGGFAAVLVSAAAPLAVVVARSPDVRLDAARVVRELTSQFGGRGGGKPELAQAGGLTGDAAMVVAAGRAMIEAGLSS